MDKLIKGIGVLLETDSKTLIFQERDKNIARNPEMIAPFGGGIEKDETPTTCAIREIKEELELEIQPEDLKEIGLFQSHFTPGTYLKIFLLKNVNLKDLVLHEGKSIKEMNIEEALTHPKVTDFTKEILVEYKNIIKKE